MNVRCEPILLLYVIFFSLLSGCVKENTDDCDPNGSPGVNIYFYTKTPCQVDSVYPEVIKDITVYLFDKNEYLVAYKQTTNVNLEKGFYLPIEVTSGLYSVLAWSGLSDEYLIINEPEYGITTKNDLLFRLKRNEQIAYSLENRDLFYGEYPNFYIEEKNTTVTQWENIAVNMQEIINHITITVEGLESPNDYEIIIEANNGSMNLNGTIAPDETLIYEATYNNEDEILDAYFGVLKLQTGYINTIVIRSKIDGTELYRGNLLGTLLLKNPDVNLDCDHDFIINFTAQDQCDCGTYMITEIWVNNWLVHSYDTQM